MRDPWELVIHMHCSSVWAVVVQGYRGILSTEKYFKA